MQAVMGTRFPKGDLAFRKMVLTNHGMAYMFSGSQKASSFVKYRKKRDSFFEKLASFLHTVINEKVRSLWNSPRFLVKWSPDYTFMPWFLLHGGPSEAGDCNHPPPKMATAKNATSGKATFDHVIGIGSLRILACEQVLDIANPWYSNGRSSRDSLASRGTRIFQRKAGDSIERGRWLTTKYF